MNTGSQSITLPVLIQGVPGSNKSQTDKSVWVSLGTLGKWHNSILKQARVAVIQFVLVFFGVGVGWGAQKKKKGKIDKTKIKKKEPHC
jgi:phosphotransferase system  glucose/maltose/N-acetylglucosamine-specific IIC component